MTITDSLGGTDFGTTEIADHNPLAPSTAALEAQLEASRAADVARQNREAERVRQREEQHRAAELELARQVTDLVGRIDTAIRAVVTDIMPSPFLDRVAARAWLRSPNALVSHGDSIMARLSALVFEAGRLLGLVEIERGHDPDVIAQLDDAERRAYAALARRAHVVAGEA
jgi:hypothetical protein